MAVNFKGFSSVAQLVAGPVTGDPGSITNATTLDFELAVPGCTPDMHFIVTAPSLVADLVLGGAFCTTAGTLKIRIGNISAAPINPASQSFYILGL